MASTQETIVDCDDNKLRCWWKKFNKTDSFVVYIKRYRHQVEFDVEDIPEIVEKLLRFYIILGYDTATLPNFEQVMAASVARKQELEDLKRKREDAEEERKAKSLKQ